MNEMNINFNAVHYSVVMSNFICIIHNSFKYFFAYPIGQNFNNSTFLILEACDPRMKLLWFNFISLQENYS